MWPCCLCCMLHGCPPVWPGYCLGGGRLGQRLNATDAAWAVAGWGKGRMGQMLRGRWQGGAEAAGRGCLTETNSNPAAAN
jgi:hypothetical protein